MHQKTQFPATPRIIALLVAAGLVVLMQLYAAIPLVDPVAADLDTSSGTATLALSTCFSLSYAAASALAHEGTWRWLFAGSGIVFLAFGLAVLVLLTEPARTRETTLAGQFRNLGQLLTQPRILLLAGALTTLLLSFVAMYYALGPHLEAAGLSSGAVLMFRLVGLPGMFVALLAGPLATRIGVAATARVGFLLAAVGLVGEAALSATVVGTAMAILVFVTGVALAVPSMITLFGMSSAPHRGAGMALNGFFLFLGASLGPLTTQTEPGVRVPPALPRRAALPGRGTRHRIPANGRHSLT